MAVKLKVVGNGHFRGSETHLAGFSVDEDSTPLNPADASGGTGRVVFSVLEDGSSEGTILLLNDTVELSDDSNGVTRGKVSSVEVNKGVASVAADSALNRLNVEAAFLPFTGTFGNALRYYLTSMGVTSNFVIDNSIENRSVTFPAYFGNSWEMLKDICTAQQVEVSFVSNNVVIRKPNTRIAQQVNVSDTKWSISAADIAQYIEIYYYNNEYKTHGLAYPTDIWTEDVSAPSVEARETQVTTVAINASLTAVQQPVHVDFVDHHYAGPDSVYSVIDVEGLPVPISEWTANGGSITAKIIPGEQALELHITGANMPERAPFRIASTYGENTYGSLRIVGTGVFTDKQLLTLPTGATSASTERIIGVTVDNPFISTLAEAYTAGMKAAASWGGADQKLSGSALVINRKGEKGSTKYPTFKDFNAEWQGKTIKQFNTAWAGKTFADFTAYYFELVADDFENQAFGNAAGARIRYRDAWYRIRSANISESGITYSAECGTMVKDFKAVWEGATIADFNTRFEGKTFADFGVIPLWR